MRQDSVREDIFNRLDAQLNEEETDEPKEKWEKEQKYPRGNEISHDKIDAEMTAQINTFEETEEETDKNEECQQELIYEVINTQKCLYVDMPFGNFDDSAKYNLVAHNIYWKMDLV